MTFWTKVEDDLPADGEEVLVLARGVFGDEKYPLRQRVSNRVFDGSFLRQEGWSFNGTRSQWPVIAWAKRPEDPKETK